MIERKAPFCFACGSPTEPRLIQGRMRPVCTSCGQVTYFDPKVAVVVFIVRDERVLLVQRKYDPGMGKWAMPAGFVEHDEDPAETAVREVHEETGLVVKVERLLEVFPRRDHGVADIVIAYAARVIAGEAQPMDDAADLGWFTRDALPELVFYPSQTLIGDRWRRGLI